MPSTPTNPTRAASRAASLKADHRIAKTRTHRDASPALIPAARLIADTVWNKQPVHGTGTSVARAHTDDIFAVSETTFFFQHPSKAVVAGITAIVDDAADALDDGEVGAFPAPFRTALEAIARDSGWAIEQIDTFCGGLLPGVAHKGMPVARTVSADINDGNASTVVVPYDAARFGDLYDAAMPAKRVEE